MGIETYPLVSDWLALSDGRLLVRTGKVDIGQRISTALAGIVQQELALAPELIKVPAVRIGDAPDEGMTSASNSVEQSGHALRLAAASLRARLVALAAERTGSEREGWSVKDGKLFGPDVNRPMPLLDLAGEIDLAFSISEDAPLLAVADSAALPMRGLSDLVKGNSGSFTISISQECSMPASCGRRTPRRGSGRLTTTSRNDSNRKGCGWSVTAASWPWLEYGSG